MDSHDVMEVQHQIRENSEDLQKYLLELESWEKEMKKKEEEFKLHKTTPEEEIPPIRNLFYRPKKKRNHKKQRVTNGADKAEVLENGERDKEKDNTETECNHKESIEVSYPDDVTENSSEHEEEIEILRKKQSALLHKEKGNMFFKKGNYDSAINSYTTGIMLDPENPLLLANRAMAFLKKEQYQAAENDCNVSLSFDPTYVKAYLRRGAARKKLNKLSLAKEDFSKALELEPENKQAQTELKHVNDTNVCDNTDIKGSDEKVKMQISENKPIKHTTEKLEISETSDFFNLNNDCIFPDSIPVPPPESSVLNSYFGHELEIETKEMDEQVFVKTVQEKMNSLKKDTSQFNINSQMESVNINLKPTLPPIPTTSFQFIADWNEISNNSQLRYQYLKQFPPEKLPVVFKHYMEPSVFPTLLETLASSFIKHEDDVFDYMKYLPNIGRFSTTLMFLSEKEEADLKKLLECVKSSNKPKSQVLEVLSKYSS